MTDHDLLTRIDANLEAFMKKVDDHIREDKSDFEKLEKKVDGNSRIIWMAIGALSLVSVLIKLVVKGGRNGWITCIDPCVCRWCDRWRSA